MTEGSYHAHMRALRDRTAPQSRQLARLQRRLVWARRAPLPVDASRQLGPRLVAAVAVAGAATALMAVAHLVPISSPAQQGILSSGVPTERQVGELVAMTFEGLGSVREEAGLVEVVWQHGALALSVEPDRGARVAVTTDEAAVWVTGTAFEVHRGDTGTRVQVDRGSVRVRCRGGGSAELGPGEVAACLRPPHDLLELGVRLRAQGAPAERVRAVAEAGLASSAALGWTRHELLALQISALVDLGDAPAALEAIDAYLDAGIGPRRAPYGELALELALRSGSCAAARRYLTSLDAPTPTQRLRVEGCGAGDADTATR